MVKSEWYTNKTWNGSIDDKFEKYLKHTRDPANKADYMQIQGSLLLDSNQQNIQNVGVALLSRLIEDYPLEYTSVIAAQEKLGDFYLQQNNYKEAEFYFRKVANYCKEQHSRSGTSTIADLKLAETILKSGPGNNLDEAFNIVMEYPTGIIKLMNTKFYYHELAAHVCDAMGKNNEAKKFAITALALPQIIKPADNKTTIKYSGRHLRTLHEIVAS